MADENTPDVEQDSQETDHTESASPWQDDLAAAFEDEGTRTAVDEFLRGKVQPYVTQLEQKTAPNRDADRLYSNFQEDPQGTYIAVTRELFGPEAAQRAIDAINRGEDPEEAVAEQQAEAGNETPEFQVDYDELPPEVREAVEAVNEQRQEAAFERELARVKEDNPEVEFDDELFYPFISAAEGDLDLAAVNYAAWLEKAADKFSPEVPDEISTEAAEAEAERQQEETPPQTLSTKQGGSAGAAPPQQAQGQTLDEAITEWLAEERAKGGDAPVTV